MKRLLISTVAMMPMLFSAPTEGAPAPPAPVVVSRERQNGFTRPLSGTMTGLVWDIADEISAAQKRPALRDEVWKEYQNRLPGANSATLSTQYSRWCGFHNVQEALRKLRAEQKKADEAAKAAEDAAKAAEKQAKEEAKAAEAAAKEKAKAEKAAAKEAEKAAKAQAKAEAAAKAKAEKEAAAKAAAEAAAKAAAEAAAVPPAPTA